MNIPVTDWPRVFELLDTVLELDQAARASWIDQLGEEHADLRLPLKQLLAQRASMETAEFMAQPVQAAAALIANQQLYIAETLQPDTLIGNYKLIRELGRGGMGTVWLAERHDNQLNRQVALKLPYVGPLQANLVARFVRERDILAALTHPHIARLYDAGASADGQPFLAMEYVEGKPINEYCDQHYDDLNQRIALFLQVLHAVKYAHANLVIHRDLKPNNILVTREGQVKLLDFGIAKLIDNGDAGQTALTQLGGRVLTPDYASPEQVIDGSISTASDVYSLGVVLFELLSGQRPYKLKRDTRAALEEAILHVDAPQLSKVDINAQAVETRSTTIKKLRKQLAGDIEVILLTALKKNPSERYASIDTFAQDLERYLNNLPVLAQPDKLWYRTRKFVSRNRYAVGGVAAIAVALLVGSGVALWQAHRAKLEAQRAQAVRVFLVKLFSASNPE